MDIEAGVVLYSVAFICMVHETCRNAQFSVPMILREIVLKRIDFAGCGTKIESMAIWCCCKGFVCGDRNV